MRYIIDTDLTPAQLADASIAYDHTSDGSCMMAGFEIVHDVYVALRDEPGRPSTILGAFTDEPAGRKAADADHEGDAENPLRDKPLSWENDSSNLTADGTIYWVRQLELNRETTA